MTTQSKPRTINRQPVPEPDRRYFRIKEAAAYLGATEWFIYTLTWKRAIPFAKIGKRLVFDRVDLDNYIQNTKTAVA